ncbi:MAG TPA: hypothetical protein VLC97_09155 [Rhodanobacteraceae bacterium]|nr:hypothetical protein [Rhodanobacteraceae bacterium]
MIARRIAPIVMAAATAAAHGGDFDVRGFADFRLVSAAEETSWTQGGLGKTRYGGGDDTARVGGAAVVASWHPAPAWLAVADLRYEPQADSTFALVEAYLRYRPVSTDAWRWSFKLGEFFPPISLETDGVAWTSIWTIAPSAVNTWVGEELRVVGGEARLEHRGEINTFEGGAAVFAANDPLGEILAARGWAIGDLVSGFGSHLREPDNYANNIGSTPPRRYDPFLEIDHRVGAYADLTWRSTEFGRATLLYYDNRADPSEYHTFNQGDHLFAWRTKFTSIGATTDVGRLVLIAQGIAGTTEIAPPGFRGEAHFAAGYVLAGWNLGAWRPAVRVDAFMTRQDPASPASEHGNAVTLALNWRPLDWLRLTGEALRIDSTTDQRRAIGLAPRQIDTQVMFNARLLF